MALTIRPNIRSYLDWLTQSTLEIFSAELQFVLESSAKHEACLQEVQGLLGSYGKAHLSSTSALLLFKGQLDVTLLVLPNEEGDLDKNGQIRALEQCQRLLRPGIKSSTLSTDSFEPILEMMYGSSSSDSSIELDVVSDKTDLQRSRLLRQYILNFPWMLPALRLILKWGRGTGLFAQRKHSLLPSVILVLLCINVAIDEGYIEPMPEVSEDVDSQWSSFCSLIPDVPEPFCSKSIGKFLVSLFSRPMGTDNLEVHPSLQDVVGCTNFGEVGVPEGWSILAEQMEIAGHALMLNGNASVLLSKSMTEKAFFLTRHAARGIFSSVKQHMRWLKDVSGADVATGDIHDKTKFGLVIRALGADPQHVLSD